MRKIFIVSKDKDDKLCSLLLDNYPPGNAITSANITSYLKAFHDMEVSTDITYYVDNKVLVSEPRVGADIVISWRCTVEVELLKDSKRLHAYPIQYLANLGVKQFTADVLKEYETGKYAIVHQSDNMLIADLVNSSMFTIENVLKSVIVVLRKGNYGSFKLDQLAVYLNMNLSRVECDSEAPDVLKRYMTDAELLSTPTLQEKIDKFKESIVNSADWNQSVEEICSYLTNVKNQLTGTRIEASRRLIIDPIVVAVTYLLDCKWSVENRVKGDVGHGPLDYAINGVPIRSVFDDVMAVNDADDNADDNADPADDDPAVDDALRGVHLESKASGKLDDNSLAQFGIQLYDQHKKAKVSTPTYGFLTTGQQWMSFSISNAVNGEDSRPIFKYHGMMRLRVFGRIPASSTNLDDSGMDRDGKVDIDEIRNVMAALAACLSPQGASK